ncbi:MAG: hypothetical protein K8S18_04965 [Desulfobacula sp.]|nr:hypothetical protein [Desulfobacula sp.]
MTTLYNASPKTGKYLTGQDCEARLNPMYHEKTHDIADKYLYNPQTSNLMAPPACGKNECALLESGEWVKKIDRVGQHYYRQEGIRVEIKALGVDIPEGCLQDDPPTRFHKTHDGSVWIENTAKKEAHDIETQRQSAIQAERDESGLKNVTIDQAKAFIASKIDAAKDVEELKTATKVILNKIVAFII